MNGSAPAFDPALLDELESGLSALGLQPERGRSQRLLAYIALLARWNRTYNLTAVDEPWAMVSRHLLDSLSIAAHLSGQRVLDLGSGAGLPGIPLAIWFPEREFHLLDGNGKKVRFLFQAKLALGLSNVSVHHARAESFRDAAGFDCITCRAFASLREILRVCAHLLAPQGCLLAMKGHLDADELAGVGTPYTVASLIRLRVPGIDAERQLLRIERQEASGP